MRGEICRYCNLNGYLRHSIRRRMYDYITKPSDEVKASSIELLGCTIEEARAYLENQFDEGMNWNNIGDWHIDHRRPCATFNFELIEHQKMCFHFTNLQPLWASDNLSKGAKFDEDSFEWKWNGSRWERKE